jgi:hypothetical protein
MLEKSIDAYAWLIAVSDRKRMDAGHICFMLPSCGGTNLEARTWPVSQKSAINHRPVPAWLTF